MSPRYAETRVIRYSGELVEATAIRTPLPGLSIVTQPEGDYSLTHDRSGTAVLFADSPELIARVLPELAHVDWTREGTVIQGDEEAKRAAWDAQRSAGRQPASQVGDGSDLPGMAL